MKLSRRSFVAALCAAALLFVFHWAWAQGKSNVPAAAQSVDLLLTGGEVHDGTGAKARKADVGIKGDRIAFIGDAKKSKVTAARTIDVKGLIVTPGFIDTHTHAGDDLANESRKGNVNYLTQGVTTVSVGNDGHGSSHILPILQKWETQGIGTNAFLLAGHGAIRREVLGPGDVQPTPEQLEKMKALVREAMQSGAFGLSSGLFYTPGTYSKTEEVIELARVAGEMGGIYDTHMRDESSYSIGFLGSIRESIRIAREGKVHLNIAHIKCLGPDVWGQSAEAIALVRAAQREGVSITADQYPYTASGTGLNAALLPPWAQAGRREEVLAKLKDPAQREKLLKDMTDNLKRRGGADSLLFRS
jgi:N-acyl-D-aspartate/D-glutamate deacylase